MIFESCPYCEGFVDIDVPDDTTTPYYAEIECPNCGKDFVEYVSALEAKAYKAEDNWG